MGLSGSLNSKGLGGMSKAVDISLYEKPLARSLKMNSSLIRSKALFRQDRRLYLMNSPRMKPLKVCLG